MFRTARSAVVGLALCVASTALGLVPAAAASPRTAGVALPARHRQAGPASPSTYALGGSTPGRHRTPVRTLPARYDVPVRTLPARTGRVPVRAASATGGGRPAAAPLPRAGGSLAPLRPDLLRVTLDDGHGHVSGWSLWCHPAGGSARGASAACVRLDTLGGPLGPTPKRELCSMVYGGPQTARITGTWHGRRVDETYGRGNGCQTSRWQRMVPVLPGVTGGGSRSPLRT